MGLCHQCTKWQPVERGSAERHTGPYGVCRRAGASTVAVAVTRSTAMILGAGSFLTGPDFGCQSFVPKEIIIDRAPAPENSPPHDTPAPARGPAPQADPAAGP